MFVGCGRGEGDEVLKYAVLSSRRGVGVAVMPGQRCSDPHRVIQ